MLDFRTCQAPIAHRLPESLTAAASLCVIPAVKVELFRAVADIGERLERLSDVSEETRACGIFNSFDFHYAVGSPKLIEVNSNAGGAFVQAELDRSMWDTLDPNCRTADVPAYDPSSLILDCWRQLRPGRSLVDVAIIESFPEKQPLFSDMKLAVRSLLERGIRARIATPESLHIYRGKLQDRYGQIDLAYNRLTDFELSCDSSKALRTAWLEGLAIVAPNPNVHEGYADKKHLAGLAAFRPLPAKSTDPVLDCEIVTPKNAESLWLRKKSLVFKPTRGYGSNGVLRGAKMTKGRFREIIHQNYVAQRFVAAPISRATDDDKAGRKIDIRVWTHGSRPVLIGARLYSGQVTTLRNSGDGIASIVWRSFNGKGMESCYVQ